MTTDIYNGWTNYATWRVNRELFSGGPDWLDYGREAYGMGLALNQYAIDRIEESTEPGLARDYALAFLSDVNWFEIAQHLKAEHATA